MDTECSPTPYFTSSGCKEETRAEAEERIALEVGFMESMLDSNAMEEEEQELPVDPMEAEKGNLKGRMP